MSGTDVLFEDMFEVKSIDADGKKFDKVSRIKCYSEAYAVELELDINTDIYKISVDTKFKLVLTSSLNTDRSADKDVYEPTLRSSLLDRFEYAMYGRVFKYELEKPQNIKVMIYASFGGLLMMMKGDSRNLQGIEMDTKFYLLMRKV